MTPLGLLAAGFGGIGRQDHQSAMYLPAFASHPGFELVGVVDLDGSEHAKVSGHGAGEKTLPDAGASGAARTAAEAYSVPVRGSYTQALSAPAVNVVCVAAPMEARAGAVATALRAGKHVLADKPLAGSEAEIRELADLAAAQNVILMPAHYHRFQPALRSVGAALRTGRIGLPWNLQADFLVSGGDPAPGGELGNLAVHPIDVVASLLDTDVVGVRACGSPATAAAGLVVGDDAPVVLMLDHQHGVTSTVTVGRLPALRDLPPGSLVVHRYRISGSHGVLLADALRPVATVHTASRRFGRWSGLQMMASLLDAFQNAVLSGGGNTVPGVADALRVERILAGARESLHTGHRTDIADTSSSDGQEHR